MPNIDSSLIPLVSAGSLFPTLTTNNTLAIRWLTPNDPHFFDVYNRPMGDIAVRQLIVAKSVDQLGLSVSSRVAFPFLNNPTVDVSTSTVSLPTAWIWDMHVTIKDDYENLRLAFIQRFPGSNNATENDFTGVMRFVFTANLTGNASEIGMFYVDYEIDSDLTYQIRTIRPATVSEHPNPLPSSEEQAIAGFVVFRTISTSENSEFFVALAPPADAITGNVSEVEPNTYEISDTLPGGANVTGDFSFDSLIHGTGLLVVSAYNVIPPLAASELTILSAINYPWRVGTSLVSTDQNSTIPSSLFSQFILTSPMGNRSDALEENFQVKLTRIRRLDTSADSLQFVFSTNSTIIGDQSDTLIEFATMTLERGMNPGTLVEIEPFRNLRNNQDNLAELFGQNFGSGFVILSTEWQANPAIADFFDSFINIVDEPADRIFSSVLNEFALHRTPHNIPTIGEAQALAGSTARRDVPIHPSSDNRYVTEQDQGLGDRVDFREDPSFDDNPDIEPVGFTGSFLTKSIVLKVNTANNADFNYETDILPRLIRLLGRNPVHGDEWYDGTTFKKYDQLSTSWIG